jgi:hypothetical protein
MIDETVLSGAKVCMPYIGRITYDALVEDVCNSVYYTPGHLNRGIASCTGCQG